WIGRRGRRRELVRRGRLRRPLAAAADRFLDLVVLLAELRGDLLGRALVAEGADLHPPLAGRDTPRRLRGAGAAGRGALRRRGLGRAAASCPAPCQPVRTSRPAAATASGSRRAALAWAAASDATPRSSPAGSSRRGCRAPQRLRPRRGRSGRAARETTSPRRSIAASRRTGRAPDDRRLAASCALS